MRIDKRLNATGCTSRQVFFIECWGNLSHKDSIDTDRVSFNNPLNALKELLFLYRFGDKFKGVEKRARAAEELFELLSADKVVCDAVFEGIPDQLLVLMTSVEVIRDSGRSPIEKKRKLVESIAAQLIASLEEHYIVKTIGLLDVELQKTTDLNDEDLNCIVSLTNGLMSMVLTLGMPLSECYLLFQRILLGKKGNAFSERFNSWKDKLCVPQTTYEVSLVMENDRLHDMLISAQTPLSFNGCVYAPFLTDKQKKATSIKIKTQAISILSAKTNAEAILVESLDVVAYMIGKSVINTHNAFTVTDEQGKDTHIGKFENEINVNSDRLTLNEFSFFIDAISTLYVKTSRDSVKKISSAFHFLRNGVSNTSKESKYTSFWSALESLTLGVSAEDLTHDEHVIYSVVPCMGVDYVVKQMVLTRDVIRSENMVITDSNGTVINFESMDLATLYRLLKERHISSQIENALSHYPYAAFMFRKFLALCNDHREMAKKIIKHADKVTLQLHRLYILRNSIVHNAESSMYIDFLTANLEHYLRGTINAMFYMASTLPKVSSPEEAFIRYHHMYETMLKNLEPTYRVTKQAKINEINGKLGNGGMVTKDDELVKWLKLHS